MNMPWADLAEDVLFKPLGMNATSYRHADYQKAPNRALIHVPAGNKTWVAKYSRDADAEAPAGGASLPRARPRPLDPPAARQRQL